MVFTEKKAFLWFKDSDLSSAITIGVKEGGLFKVLGLIQALVHSTVSPCELWHRRFGHLHFKALPGLQKWYVECLLFSLIMIMFAKAVC